MSIAGQIYARAKGNIKKDIDKYKAKKKEAQGNKKFEKKAESIRAEAYKRTYREERIKQASRMGVQQARQEVMHLKPKGNLADRLAESIDKGIKIFDFALASPDKKNMPRIALENYKDKPRQLDNDFLFGGMKKGKRKNNLF